MTQRRSINERTALLKSSISVLIVRLNNSGGNKTGLLSKNWQNRNSETSIAASLFLDFRDKLYFKTTHSLTLYPCIGL